MSNKELISSRHLPQRLENLDFSEDLMDRVASLPNAEGLFDEIKNDDKCRAVAQAILSAANEREKEILLYSQSFQREQETFFSYLAHELRGPVTGARAVAEFSFAAFIRVRGENHCRRLSGIRANKLKLCWGTRFGNRQWGSFGVGVANLL